MTTYQRSLRGKIILFAKGHFLKGLDTPALPSDVLSVAIASMNQSKGRLVCSFCIELSNGKRSPHVQVSFPINEPSDWTLHGVYSAGVFDSFFSPDDILCLRERVS